MLSIAMILNGTMLLVNTTVLIFNTNYILKEIKKDEKPN